MITLVCRCAECKHEWTEEDVRIVPPGEFEKAQSCEKIRCPKCDAVYDRQVQSS